MGWAASHLVEVYVNGGKEVEGRLCRERGSLLEYGIGIGIDTRDKMKSLHDWRLIPKETFLMGCFIQPIQLRLYLTVIL